MHKDEKHKKSWELPGIEPGTSRTIGRRCTSGLWIQLNDKAVKLILIQSRQYSSGIRLTSDGSCDSGNFVETLDNI